MTYVDCNNPKNCLMIGYQKVFMTNNIKLLSRWLLLIYQSTIELLTRTRFPSRRKRQGRPSIDGDMTVMHRGHSQKLN